MSEAQSVEEAMAVDFDALGWGEPNVSQLERLTIDTDYCLDFRNLLICFQDRDFSIREFLAYDSESERYLDLRRAYNILKALAAPHPTIDDYYPGRDELTKLAIDNSLCPIHFVDWAICFDDRDPECEQVRKIYPNCHDT